MEQKSSPVMRAVKEHAPSVVVGSATVLIGGILLLLATGVIRGDSSSAPVQLVETATQQRPPEPKNFRQAVTQRSIWRSAPLLLEPKNAEEPLAPLKVAEIDIKVLSIRELVENPERYVRNPVVFVGDIVQQQDVPGQFIDHEYRLVDGHPLYDAYVASSRYSYAETGKPAWVVGQLIGVGSTRDPSGRLRQSVYVDTRSFDYEISSVDSYYRVGSRAVAQALRKLRSDRQGTFRGGG